MKKNRFIYIQFILVCILSNISSYQLFGQKIIKVGVVYTAKAEEKVPTDIEEKALDQIHIIENILQNSGIDDLEIEVSFTELKEGIYKEPKYRNNGYIRFSFDGTYQVLDEISNHANLMSYFRNNDVNSFDEDGINYIDKDELSRSLIGINALSKPNLVLFIADEDGPPNISEFFPEDITTHTSRTFFSIINAEVFSKIDISLALGFFGIFIDDSIPDLDSDNVPSKSSFLSYWEYDDVTVKRELSKDNIDLFRCHLSKLELTSPEKMEVGGVYINAETHNSVVDFNDHLTIVPSSPVNKRNYSVIAPDGDDYSFVMAPKRQRINYPICSSEVRPEGVYYLIDDTDTQDNMEEINMEKVVEQSDDINLFTPVKIKAYPNPTSGMITYEFVLPKPGEYRVALYNNFGQEVKSSIYKNLRVGFNQIKEDYRRLDDGMYIYRLESEKKEPITGKIILSK